jgi:hypothetical protein
MLLRFQVLNVHLPMPPRAGAPTPGPAPINTANPKPPEDTSFPPSDLEVAQYVKTLGRGVSSVVGLVIYENKKYACKQIPNLRSPAQSWRISSPNFH